MVNATDAAEGYVGRHIAAYKSESDPKNADPDFLAGGWSVRIAEEVNRLLNEGEGRNQVWLGNQMGVSRARVSYIVNASPNITLYTLAKLAVALGVRAEVSLNPDRYRSEPKPSLEEEAQPVDPLPRTAVMSGTIVVGTANATS